MATTLNTSAFFADRPKIGQDSAEECQDVRHAVVDLWQTARANVSTRQRKTMYSEWNKPALSVRQDVKNVVLVL